MRKQTINVVSHPHHLRTVIAALCGAIGVSLVLTSILVIGLERTLVDNASFSSSVAPLVTKPAIQNFVVEKVTDALIQNTSTQELATSLFPASQVTAETIPILQSQVKSIIHNNVSTIVKSDQFASLWQTTVASAHKQLITELNSNTTNLTLDLTPAVTGIVAQLKQTDLAPISDKIITSPDTGKLNLTGSGISKAQRYYRIFNDGAVVITLAAIVMVALSILISVHHSKTVRRILTVVGVELIVLAALLQIPYILKAGTGDGHIEKAAALAFAEVLLHNLQIASLIIGLVCLIVALASKFYSMNHAKRTRTLSKKGPKNSTAKSKAAA